MIPGVVPTPRARDAPWDAQTRGTGLNPFPAPSILTARQGRKNEQQLNVFGHLIWDISFQPQFLPLNIRLGTFIQSALVFRKKNERLKKFSHF